MNNSIHVTATTFLSEEELLERYTLVRYKSTREVREELLQRGASVRHGVDACHLPDDLGDADAIVFNYPHLGDAPADCHRALLAHFLIGARRCLGTRGVSRRVQMVMAAERGKAPTDRASFATGVLRELEGQSPEAAWSCRRKWRNGSLGFVHWASQFGYEHRRHESEQTMSIDNSLSFVFTTTRPTTTTSTTTTAKTTTATTAAAATTTTAAAAATAATSDAAFRPPIRSGAVCQVCEQDFPDEAALAAHLAAPAAPLEAAAVDSWRCESCQRGFNSQRALGHHVTAGTCQKQGLSNNNSNNSHNSNDNNDNKNNDTSVRAHNLRPTPAGHPQDAKAAVVLDVVVSAENDGLRLLHYARQLEKLRVLLPSKSLARRAIAEGELTLNGCTVEETRKLQAGDLVRLSLDKAKQGRDATAGRAKYVKVVATGNQYLALPLESTNCAEPEGDAQRTSWEVVSARCPPEVAVVWKPAGMRSLGAHAGTLQASLALLPGLTQEAPTVTWRSPMPLSRLEIGCPGLSLVALTEKSHLAFSDLMAQGKVTHVFRTLVHGRLGEEGHVLRWWTN
ncbi:unnamed protein product [Polarella glacialis]|uniref:25S rRNA (uridine-N(3))-methyltransferase BMT5-like domain-containing protein n=1 Tax=Polarella glacialis TaxID=89957 RepID=A0A813JDH6_POLGL|nr:unnamed protein product [Polarella glacialis]